MNSSLVLACSVSVDETLFCYCVFVILRPVCAVKRLPQRAHTRKRSMNALIVYAHPEPASFNAALKDAAIEAIVAAGHQAEVSDLYGEQFNPVAGRHDFNTV